MRHIVYKLRTIKRWLFPVKNISIRSLKRHMHYDTDTLMYESMFELLRRFVEIELSNMEVIMSENIPSIHKFIIRWFPLGMREYLSKYYGLRYLADATTKSKTGEPTTFADALSDDEFNFYTQVKELYLWYVYEYPLLQSPWETTPDVEFTCIDDDGNPTNELFSRTMGDRLHIVNRPHPDYTEMIQDITEQESIQMTLKENKLQQLLSIRNRLWT